MRERAPSAPAFLSRDSLGPRARIALTKAATLLRLDSLFLWIPRAVLRRLSTLAPLAPAAAVIVLAAASAAAQGIAGARNSLEDIQIGEDGRILRIAVLCRDDCRVGARAGGAFFLPGIDETIDVDLSARSKLARALAVKPTNGGSLLAIRADADVARASIKPCRIGAGTASCIDLEFADVARFEADAIADAEPVHLHPDEAAALAEATAAREAAASPPADVAAEPPALREAPDEGLLRFARFAPPERLDPPIIAHAVASAVPPPPRRAAIIRQEAGPPPAAATIGEAARAILERSFGVAECGGAEARLRSDAWALEAMVDIGFCKAIAGDLEAADGVFVRLLDYTPDNYEALVGRALIAAEAGEKSVARKYFQDALNALPPIAESDRIVAAMGRL